MSKLKDHINERITGARGGIPKVRNDKIKPRHRAVLARMQAGMSMSASMIASGYTPTTAHQTDKLQATKSWQMLMDEHVPESLLTLRHNELLNARRTETKIVGRGKSQRVEVIDLGPDVTAVRAGLEMGYKLRGKFQEETRQSDKPTQVYNLFYQPNVQASIRAFETDLKQAITHGNVAEVIDRPAPEPTADGGGDDADTSAPDAGGGDADGATRESTAGDEGKAEEVQPAG